MTQFSFSHIANNTHPQWWKDPALRRNVLHCFGCCFCVFYLGYDQSLLTGLQALPQWNAFFHSPKGNELGLYAASLFLPSIVTAFVGDWIAYKFGRRIAVWCGSVLIIIGALVNALATGKGMFIGGRVILGAGGAITKVGAPALLHEIAHPRLRGVLGALYYTFYYAGSLTSACLCIAGLYVKGNWGWRFPCIAQIVGPIVVIGLTLTAPESPRYLIKNGKHEQAKAMLIKHHANGAADDPLVEYEYREITSAIEAEELVPKTKYIDFLRSPGNRRRLFAVVTLAFGTNWVGNGLISYYLSPVLRSVGVSKPVQITGINAGLAAWNLVLAQTAASNVERIGRRPLFFASIIGMFLSYVFVMALSATFAEKKNQAAGLAVIPFLFFFYGFYDIAWTPLPYHYSTEILPYALRTKGLAIFTSTQNVGNAFNQFVNPIALQNIAWRYYGVYLGVLAAYFTIAYFCYPETKGLALEEITLVFDYGRKEGRQKAAERMRGESRVEETDDVKGDEAAHVERV